MQRLAAKPIADAVKARVTERAQSFEKAKGRKPHLSVILVGEDPASQIYVKKKTETAKKIGLSSETILMSADATAEDVRAKVDLLNQDPAVDGILIQRPLPPGFSEEELVYWVDPSKDVDAFHPENVGRLQLGLPTFKPCTPHGVMKLLEHYRVETRGKLAVVIGRSSIVGKPMAALLLQADATVVQCHSRTQNLEEITRQADIIVAAAGKPLLIGKEHVKAGAMVIDVGIHRKEDGKLCGDVRYDELEGIAASVTPVPGGVGPMTIAMLFENTVLAAESRG
jgi:methylenetetrahydrofolate dehydrogenase (NADP+)/methenyltetrahydrofolate cyclohydrolase